MKKILLGMIAATMALSSFAQDAGKKERKEGRARHEKGEGFKQHGKHEALKNVDLTEDQKTRMKAENESFRQQMKDLHKNENITVKEQKEKREALAQQHKAAIENILTAEQKSQLKQARKNTGERKGEFNAQHQKRAQEELNLSDAQSSRIKSINENFRDKIQSIQKNETLTREQKKEQLEAIRKSHSDEIRSVLTQEQKQKFDQRERFDHKEMQGAHKKNKPGRKIKK